MRLLEELSVQLRLSPSDLARIIATAPARYKVYTIPKRNGGQRVIAQPSRELKAIQRYVLKTKLSKFPIHAAATAYILKRNIYDNAVAHRHGRAILKLDFKDFFPSISVSNWDRVTKESNIPEILREDRELYHKILFWGMKSRTPRCLSIGAPTSPTLANIVMYKLDDEFFRAALRYELAYTRYADDITVSGERVEGLKEFEKFVQTTLKKTRSPHLLLNEEKRGIYLKGQRRMVTGLVITPTEDISIGRERKRKISVMLHKASLGKLDTDGLAYLKGMLGFCIANEPGYLPRMRKKYGDAAVNNVLHFQPLRKGPKPR
jgi:retron-type reverse transcriptase